MPQRKFYSTRTAVLAVWHAGRSVRWGRRSLTRRDTGSTEANVSTASNAVEECYADALVSVGEWRDTDSILKEILENKGIFRPVKGRRDIFRGECMLQPDALTELLKGCQAAGVHTAVDTAGNVPWESFEQVLPYTDLFFIRYQGNGYRCPQSLHRSGERTDSGKLYKACRPGRNIFVRYPYIPGMNDDQVEKIAEFFTPVADRSRASAVPQAGNSKYRALEAQNVFEWIVPLKDEVEMLKKKYGFQ